MAYTPIERILPQYVDENGDPYSGAVLKAYAAGTSTPINFSINEAGSTLVATIALNASGYPEVSGNAVIPFLNQTYKIALYPTQAAADSNTGAVWSIDNISLQYFDGGGQEITDIGNGTARNSAIAVGQVQDSQFTYLGTSGGAADTYTLSPSVPITAYAITQHFRVKIHATNLTTTPYLQVSSITDPASTAVIKKLNASKAEIAVEASDMLTNGIYDFQRNSANTAWILMNPESHGINNIVGAVLSFAKNTPPAGWLECNGAAISRTTYAALFAAISTTFGVGDGSTTFNIPDLRGYFVRGWANGGSVDSGRSFGSVQTDAFQGHFHNLAKYSAGSDGNFTTTNYLAASANIYGMGKGSTDENNTVSVRGEITNGSNGVPRIASETRPSNLALMYCIRY